MLDDPDRISGGIQPGIGTSYGDRSAPPIRTTTRAGAVVGFVAMIGAAVFLAFMGMPGFFVGFAIFAAFLVLIGGLAGSISEEQRIMRAEEAEAEAKERFKEEVAQSVKQKLEGTIKVRCRYCGALNGEQDEKCESCGAPL